MEKDSRWPVLHATSGGALGVIVVFALLLTLARHAGLLGIPLALIALSWSTKYAFILFDHIVRGFPGSPVLDINDLNPVDEQRPMGGLLLAALCVLAYRYVHPALGWLCLGIFPACLGVLALERSIVLALDPRRWWLLVAGLKAKYLVVLAWMAGCIALNAGLWYWGAWEFIAAAAALFGLLSLSALYAGLIYDCRQELDLETWVSPERTADRQAREDRVRHASLVDEAYELLRVGEKEQAWQILTEWFGSRGRTSVDYYWLADRLSSWSDPAFATRLGQEFVEHLLSGRMSSEVLRVAEARLRVDPGFRPKNAASTLALARIAAAGGAKRTARLLLADFTTRYAGDTSIAAAQKLREEVSG